jgi:hypothetical protein
MSALDSNMLAFGSCIAGFGLLMTGLLALLFRNPKAPRWTRPEVVAMLVCVPVTATIGVGLGYTAYGLSQLVTGDSDPRQILVVAAVLIALPLAWRALSIRRRLKAYAAASGDAAPSSYLPSVGSLGIGGKPRPRPEPRAASSRRVA